MDELSAVLRQIMVLYDMPEAQNVSGMNICSVYVRNTRCMMIIWYNMLSICQKHKIYMIIIWYDMVREGFKNPRHGNFPLGGYPPPAPGASTDEIFPKS